MNKIKSLVEARKLFSTQIKCEEHLARMRWPNGVECPRCGSKQVSFLKTRRVWQCACRYQFSVTAGTIFHRTHIDLPRWMIALWMICYSPKGVSSKQIERELGVTYKTAWYMTKRIRWAIQNHLLDVFVEGEVEIDTAAVKADKGKAVGASKHGFENVIGMASRDQSSLRMFVIDSLKQHDIERVCNNNLGWVKQVYTDKATAFQFLRRFGMHETVNHSLRYVDGKAHTNFVENAWSLFKRGLIGVYHHVSAKHLQEYLDGFAFRYTYRADRARMMDLVLASC